MNDVLIALAFVAMIFLPACVAYYHQGKSSNH